MGSKLSGRLRVRPRRWSRRGTFGRTWCSWTIRLSESDDAEGIEACRLIKEERPQTQVVMFTSYGEKESVLASILAGATGFLTKNVSHARLEEAIRAAGRGESLLDPRVTREVIGRLTELARTPVTAAPTLSERESEILRLVAQGKTNKEIAATLYLSPFIARNHVIHILDKLGSVAALRGCGRSRKARFASMIFV